MTSQNFSASKVPLGLGSGSRLVGYELEEQFGEGSMAVAFRARGAAWPDGGAPGTRAALARTRGFGRLT